MEIMIRNHADMDESERILALVEGLEKAELCKLSTALLVSTEDEQVAGLLARYGTRLDGAPVSAVPPANNRGRGGRRKKVDGGPMPAPVAASEPVPDPTPDLDPDPEPMPEPNPVIEPVARKKKAGRPTRGITSTLASDLQKIVAEAGQKSLNGRAHSAVVDVDAGTVVEGPTIYTDPLTGNTISYGDMRERLLSRQVNAKERFISNRQGLMEVYDKGPGKKLILVKVEDGR